jgi:hypothetical protein
MNNSSRVFCRYLVLGLIGLLIGCATPSETIPRQPGKRYTTEPKYIDVPKVVIWRNSSYDIDCQRMDGNPPSNRDPSELASIAGDQPYGASGKDTDIHWGHSSGIKRQLYARNGSGFAYLGNAPFDDITAEDLTCLEYTDSPIDGGDEIDQMVPGSVIAVRTAKGNFAKLRVEGYHAVQTQDMTVDRTDLICSLGIYVFSPVQFRPMSEFSTHLELTPTVTSDPMTPNWNADDTRVLKEADNGLETQIHLGPPSCPDITLRLQKSEGSEYYDTLTLDRNLDGQIGPDEILKTKPRPDDTRKIRSLFKTVIQVPTTDPQTGDRIINPYILKIWYMDTPKDTPRKVLHFAPQFWLRGQGTIEGVKAEVIIRETVMDGVINEKDRWAVIPISQRSRLDNVGSTRTVSQPGPLGTREYKIQEIHPSGRRITLVRTDPFYSCDNLFSSNTLYLIDQTASHSGKPLYFLADFDAAEKIVRDRKRLLLFFEVRDCQDCWMMAQHVFTADVVTNEATNVVAVRLDGNLHHELASRFKVTQYPTTILLTDELEEIRRMTGYRGVSNMRDFLKPDPRSGKGPD